MTTVFDDIVGVAYGQIYVVSDPAGFIEGFEHSRGGQANGLCGAATAGLLYLTTGLHTGRVRFTIEVWDSPAPLPEEWEDIVEASFRPATDKVTLTQWAGEASWPLPLRTVDYRVRYCATDMDQAPQLIGDEPGPDRYLLQFWPAPPAPDVVVRQSSRAAAYWHGVARETPAPPTAEERAEAERRRRKEHARRQAELRRKDEARYWGGRGPGSDRLRKVAPSAVGLARLDRELVDEIAAAEPPTQRAMAAWAARHACTHAGMISLDWIAEALDALDRGDPPPPWFADFDTALARWLDIPRTSITYRATLSMSSGKKDKRSKARIDPGISAIHAVLAAREDDPLVAALVAVRTAIEISPERQDATAAAFRAAFGLPSS